MATMTPTKDCGVVGCPMATTHADYLRDAGRELREQAVAARAYAREHRDDGFAQGVAHGDYVALSLMLHRASAFRISAETLGLEGLDPESDLL